MILFVGINNINDVIMYKGDSVYFNKDDVKINGYFGEDIIGLNVYYKDKLIGVIKNILKSKAHDIFSVVGDKYKCLIPDVDEFIKLIDLENKKVIVENVEGLLNEN